MKKLAEVGSQEQVLSDLVARVDEMGKRIERIDPTPKLETLQPYPVGTQVYSVADLEGRYPLLVRGYDRPGHVLVTVLPGEPERSLPLESVRTLAQCPRATPAPGEAFANITDAKARAFFEGRRKAQIAAATKPFTPPIAAQERYGRTGTLSGGRMVYDE
jgi:hypothetical protein